MPKQAERQRPDYSLFRLGEDVQKSNMQRISSHSKKRKLDKAIPEAQEAPTTKSPKSRKGVAPEVIVIEDDPPLDGIQESQAKTKKNGESVEEIRVIVENLRDQVSDWTLRAQQTETSVAAVLAKIGDGTMWKEDILALIANNSPLHGDIARLVERVEHLENNHTGCSCSHSRISSTCDPSKTALKASTHRPDNIPARSGAANLRLHSINLKTPVRQVFSDAVSTGRAKSASPERAGLALNVLTDTSISLGEGCWGTQHLSNKGLKELLQKVDFRNVAHLGALNALDGLTTPRDCVMFCDTQSSALFQVDYILRTGTTATYIRGGRVSIMHRDKEFSDGGLKGLRVLRVFLTYEPENPNDRRKFEEWERKNAPPKYMYDVGQLFVRRCGQGRQELFGTQYNLMLDITKPRKPVWLVMRPEYTPVFIKKQTHSEKPFSKADGGLNGVGIAKLANSLAELDFCRTPFDGKSRAMFLKAQNLIATTGFRGELGLRFSSPNLDHMEDKMTVEWSGTRV
ncbi:hypothetical protein DL768_000675 [Monosporascus sp. mg162]|nr:hypothetical protein DL768_000675 [Monosporascus sp. mg162]